MRGSRDTEYDVWGNARTVRVPSSQSRPVPLQLQAIASAAAACHEEIRQGQLVSSFARSTSLVSSTDFPPKGRIRRNGAELRPPGPRTPLLRLVGDNLGSGVTSARYGTWRETKHLKKTHFCHFVLSLKANDVLTLFSSLKLTIHPY